MGNRVKIASEQVKEIILKAMGICVAENLLPNEPISGFNIEPPADSVHGDFATNAAMVSAKAFKMAPIKIAELIVQKIELRGTYFKSVKVAPPGFINFFLDEVFFLDSVSDVLKENINYGKSNFGNNKKIMVEFVSANPTGPMHIGNARGGAIGDCLASVLAFAGYDVTREFYVNDAGNQVEKFGKSLEIRALQLINGENSIELPEDCYQGQDIIALAQEFIDKFGTEISNMSSEQRQKMLVEYALPRNIEKLRTDLMRYGIEYDVWFRESSLYQSGQVERTIEILTQKGLTYENEGAIWYKATEFGAPKDEVLVRANGTPTYFAADIAYHYDKFAIRNFDTVINIWGADHHGHVQRLKGAMDAVGLDGNKLDIVLMQLVRLVRNGETVRVSKRTGKSLTLTDLLDEVPLDAARFFFNLREANSHFDFDLDLAIEQSSQNPVYYVQYAHARICGIIQKLETEGISIENFDSSMALTFTESEELELIKLISSFENEVIEAAKSYDPSRITRFAISIATLFHKFYNNCRIKGEEIQILQSRYMLCIATKQVIKNILDILKISTPENM